MDVLGHGVPETDLAHLTSPEQYTSRNADRRIAQLNPRARMTGSARNRSAAPKRHRRAITTSGHLAHLLKDAIEWEYRQSVKHLRGWDPVAR